MNVNGYLSYYGNMFRQNIVIFIHSFSILSDDRSKASSKTMPPHSAIVIFMPAKIQKYKYSSQSYSFLKKYYFHVFYRVKIPFFVTPSKQEGEVKWKLHTSEGAERTHLVERKTEESWMDSRKGKEISSFSRRSRPSFGTNLPPIRMAHRALYPGEKPWLEFDHSLRSRAQVKNEWRCTSTTPRAFISYTGKALPLPTHRNRSWGINIAALHSGVLGFPAWSFVIYVYLIALREKLR